MPRSRCLVLAAAVVVDKPPGCIGMPVGGSIPPPGFIGGGTVTTVIKRTIAALAVFGAFSAFCYSRAPVKVAAAPGYYDIKEDVIAIDEWLDEELSIEKFAKDLSEIAPTTFFTNWLGIYLAYSHMADADKVKPVSARAYFYKNENDEICVATAFQYSHSASYQVPHTTRPLVGSDGKYIEIVPTVTPSMPSSYFPSSGFYMAASPGGDPFQQAYTITNEKGASREVNTVGQSTLAGFTQYGYVYWEVPSVAEFPIYNAGAGTGNVSPLGQYVDMGGKRWDSSSSVPISLITPGMTLDELNDAVTNYFQTNYNIIPPSQPERKQLDTLPQDEYSGLPAGWNEVNPVPLPDIVTPTLPLDGSEDFAQSIDGLQFLSAFRDGLGFWARAVSWVCEQFPLAARVLLALGLLGLLAFIFWRWSL